LATSAAVLLHFGPIAQDSNKGNANMNRFSTLGLALCGVSVLAVGVAQNGPPTPQQRADTAVKLRQGLFEVQAYSFGPVGAMLRGGPFDAAVAEKAAKRVEFTSSLIPEVFEFDTRKFQEKTAAKEGIWMNKADFDSDAKNLQDAAAALEAAAKTGDKGATLKAAGAVGKACGHCHDEFREKT
jgi:cytochrome c556